MLTLLLLGALPLLAGCALFQQNRVVFVDEREDVIRLDRDVRGHVFFQNEQGQWVRSSGKVTLPAGWYAGRGPK